MKLIFIIPLLIFCSFLVSLSRQESELKSILRNKSKEEIYKILDDTIKLSLDFDKKLLYAKKYYQIALKNNDKMNVALACQNLGRANRTTAHFDSSFVYFLRASEILKELDAPVELFDNYSYLGLLSVAVNDYDGAIYYNKEASKLLDKIKPWQIRKHRIAVNNWNLGNVNIELNNLDIAQKHLETAMNNLNQIDSLPSKYHLYTGKALVWFYMGALNLTLKKYDSAIVYYKKTIEISREKDITYTLSNSLAKIGIAFNELKLYDSTIHYCSEGLEIADENYNKEYKIVALEQLSIAYFKKKEIDKAVVYFQQLVQLKHSLDDYVHKLAQLKAKYETEKEISLTEQKQKYTILLTTIIVILFIVLSIFIFYRYKKSKQINKMLNELNLSKDKLFRLISHDLRGPILNFNESINLISKSDLSINEKEFRIYLANMNKVTSRLVHLIENLFEWSKTQLSHNSKVDSINVKVEIEKVLQQLELTSILKDITFEIQVEDSFMINFEQRGFEIVLRNLILNAIKFSFVSGTIIITSYRENDKLFLEVIDSGIGMDDEVKKSLFNFNTSISRKGSTGEKGNGLGLIIINDIINKNHGKLIFLDNSPKGIIAKVEFRTTQF